MNNKAEKNKKQNNTNNLDDTVVFEKKKFSIGIALALVVILAGFWGVYYFSTLSNNETVPQEKGTTEEVKVEKTQRSLTGKTVEEDKKDALKSAQEILEASAVSPDDKTIQERVEALDNGDNSVVDPSLTEKMRFVGEFAEDEELQNTTYQALITLSSYTNDDGTISPISDDVWKQVHVDQESGIAYVPISAFYGPGATFSLELVYTEDGWKMAPYSLLDIVNLSALLQQKQTSTTE